MIGTPAYKVDYIRFDIQKVSILKRENGTVTYLIPGKLRQRRAQSFFGTCPCFVSTIDYAIDCLMIKRANKPDEA